jgi:hypothetical protein
MLYPGMECLSDEPIVAWKIEYWSYQTTFDQIVTPICADNEVNDCNYKYVLCDPTGHYHSPDGPKFDSAEEAFAYLKTPARSHPIQAA